MVKRQGLFLDKRLKKISSINYPTINFESMYEGKLSPYIISQAIKKIPEQHYAGLSFLGFVSNDYLSKKEGVLGFYKVSPNDKKTIILASHKSKEYNNKGYRFHDILAHEIGHHVVSSAFNRTMLKKFGKFWTEILADRYMYKVTGYSDYGEFLNDEELNYVDDILDYCVNIHEAKNPSYNELMIYNN